MHQCSTWRYRGAQDVAQILPVGRNHAVWEPCTATVKNAGRWCDTCVSQLVLCPSTEVRLALVEYEFLHEKYLHILSTDPEWSIRFRAEERLAEHSGVWSDA